MKESNTLEKLTEAVDHVRKADEILNKVYDDILEEEPKDKKVKVTIKVENPYDGIEISEDDLKEIKKDLEEIMNDFTRK